MNLRYEFNQLKKTYPMQNYWPLLP